MEAQFRNRIITLSGFKSKNSHNFHGNKNYYVVPKDLYSKIKDLVPNDIGIIIYYPDTNNYRIKKNVNLKKFHMSSKKYCFMTHSKNG